MKLGTFVPSYLLPGQDARHWEQIRRFAVKAEELGFDSVAISDHFQPWRHHTGHAPAALPWLGAAVAVNVEDVFQGLEVQRLRLHHDQQVPEWKGRW